MRLIVVVARPSYGQSGFPLIFEEKMSSRMMTIVGLALTVFFGVLPLLPDGKAQSPNVYQAPGSAFSYGQQNGITAGTINNNNMMLPSLGVPNHLVGATIIGNGQGPAADVTVMGSPGRTSPAVGMDINVAGKPGQSATGLNVIQNGPGTGMRVTVGGNGPAVGVRVSVGN
jgi:hypothetical protein